jgi:hypothetical protein
MSQLSQVKHRRQQGKHTATQRGDHNRYQRKQLARLTAERNRLNNTLKETRACRQKLEAERHEHATRSKVDVVSLALQLFLVARISFCAVCRVLNLRAWALGIHRAPCPQTVINWGMRLSIVRLEAARSLKGVPLRQAPFSNGLIWRLDLSIGLGTTKI